MPGHAVLHNLKVCGARARRFAQFEGMRCPSRKELEMARYNEVALWKVQQFPEECQSRALCPHPQPRLPFCLSVELLTEEG